MPRRRIAAIIGLMAVIGLATAGARVARVAATGLDPENPKVTLTDIETTVHQLYPVPEVNADQLSATLASGRPPVLFDVRERAEYERSHLAGAIHLDPDTTAEDFQSRYGALVANRNAVFYCAVGVRSGIMVERLLKAREQTGNARFANLSGGIFRWYATRRPVVDAKGPADGVHPYDGAWAKLLARTVAQSPK